MIDQKMHMSDNMTNNMTNATDHGMTEEDWKKELDKEMNNLNWKDTTSCIDWEST